MSEPVVPLAHRLRIALSLRRAGIQIMRQNLIRAHPELSGDQINERLQAWMQDRPLDAPGDRRRGIGR